MKVCAIAVLVALMSSVVLAGDPTGSPKTNPAFEKLKLLKGSWKGKDSEGKPVTATYKVVSMGSAVMETLNMGDADDMMVTMYHPDGSAVMMTHYCSMGNQPRMKAEKLSSDGSTLSFNILDVTNLGTPDENRMNALVLTFKDADHLSQTWTMLMEGKNSHADRFKYERVK